jgi:hypothetical protein
MDVRTNILQKYISAFGEAKLIKAIDKAKNKKSPGSIAQITNPVVRFLANTTYEKGGKLFTKQNTGVPPEDFGYFRLVAGVLDDLKDELKANKTYLAQMRDKILDSKQGPMLSAMNEILIAGYYKHLGIKVELNSSAQVGAADIDLADLPFATDAKMLPNKRLYLEDFVNSSAQTIVDAVKLIRNQDLLISVFTPDKKEFHKSMKALAEAFNDPNIGNYSDGNLSAHIIDTRYGGGDFRIKVQPANVTVVFQASWDMAPMINELKDIHIPKAVKQAKALSKQAIPWVFVPRDATRNGIEVASLRFFGEMHGYVLANPDIFMIPVYSLEFKDNKVFTVFDVFQTGQNIFKVQQETFQQYIDNLMKRPVLYS